MLENCGKPSKFPVSSLFSIRSRTQRCPSSRPAVSPVTVQDRFASVMKKWAEAAVEEISQILKVSSSGVGEAPAAEEPTAAQIDAGRARSKHADG